jgi:type IV secretion system protein VirB9
MFRLLFATLIGLPLVATSAFAADVPAPGDRDSRVRYVTYSESDVAQIYVRRGAVTRIVFEEGEKIIHAATGFASDCAKNEYEWCIRADRDTNQIWIKPKDRATHNNIEVRTDKRDYSIEFRVLADNETGERDKVEPMFRVIYRYKQAVTPSQIVAAIAPPPARQKSEGEMVQEKLNLRPTPKNWAYTMEVLKGADTISPTMIFDDGRFTYFQFAPEKEIPAIFYISPTGEEVRTSYHVEHGLVVIQRLGKRFVLRLGQAVVGIWNESQENISVPTKDGVTAPGVMRVLR